MLILFCGIPASGKTMIASEVAKKLKERVIHIQSDTIRQLIPIPIYDNIESEVVYSAMNSIAKIALMSNYVAILDATFLRHEWREHPLSIAKSLGKKAMIIHVKCSLDAAIRRNRQRNNPIPDNIIEKFAEIFEDPLNALKIDSEKISNQKAAEMILSKITS